MKSEGFKIFERGIKIAVALLKVDPEVTKWVKTWELERGDRYYGTSYRDKYFPPASYVSFSTEGENYEIEEDPDILTLFCLTNKRLIELSHLPQFNNLSEEDKKIFDEFIKLSWEFKEVKSEGTEHQSAGYGSDYYVVYHFPVRDLYIRFDGWYSSQEGATYSSYKEVIPQEKVIVVYE